MVVCEAVMEEQRIADLEQQLHHAEKARVAVCATKLLDHGLAEESDLGRILPSMQRVVR